MSTIFHTRFPKDSSAFLFETRAYKARGLNMVPFLLKIYRAELLFQSVIKAHIDQVKREQQLPEASQKIFTLNSSKLASRFKLLVGGESVTSSILVKNVLLGDSWHTENQKQIYEKVLDMPENFKEFYNNLRPINKVDLREPLAKTYLQASSFLKVLNDVLKS